MARRRRASHEREEIARLPVAGMPRRPDQLGGPPIHCRGHPRVELPDHHVPRLPLHQAEDARAPGAHHGVGLPVLELDPSVHHPALLITC